MQSLASRPANVSRNRIDRAITYIAPPPTLMGFAGVAP